MKAILYTAVFCFIFFNACRQKEDNKLRVTAVYPSSDTLSENLLRVYIQFSQPMKTVGNLEHIKLIDTKGKEIKGAIFNNTQELWDREQKQLTIVFDPSRVKSGLIAHSTMGRALQPGKEFSLLISDVKAINHQKLKTPFIKTFVVTRADTLAPNIQHWDLTIPASNSKNDFSIVFPEMLDFNSLKQRLIITNSKQEVIKGVVTIEKNETLWKFKPNTPWKKGHYFLFINTRLEDPSGNNLNGLFDHKIGSLKYDKEGETLHIPFVIN
ncbi:MAG: hypothetical protein AAFX55_05985 [Bacteroidota bacterium]